MSLSIKLKSRLKYICFILACLLFLSPSVVVSAATPKALAYPVLNGDVQYYRTTFPAGLRYSEGWYGTFINAPTASEIILFDDDWSDEWGISVFSMPVGTVPSGEQGGTSIEAITLVEADAIVKSYPLESSVKPFDAEILAVMEYNHFFNGVWLGDKLKQKWSSYTERLPPDQLTERQKEYIALTEGRDIKEVDLAKFDPDRFWVGDGGNWSNNAAHWSAAAGGAPGASLPTNADNVYFEASSFTIGAQTVTVDAGSTVSNSMNWTGATNTPTLVINNYPFATSGNITFISAMVVGGNNWIVLNANSALTTNGVTLANAGIIVQAGTTTLQDDIAMPGKQFTLWGGAVDTNGKTITCAIFITNGAWTVTLGASVINCSVNWELHPATTLNANTSTIKLTGTATFTGGGETYNNVELNGTAHTVAGNNTFASLTNAATSTVTLGATTQTTGAWINTGTVAATTGTIIVTGTGVFTGGGETYNNVELNGTAHTVSGNNTFNSLTIAGTATVTLGATTQTTGAWINAGTIAATTGTIIVTGTGVFTGGGETYNDVELNGTAHTISGSNIFNILALPLGTTQTITFTDGTTQTITTPILSGSAGNIHTLQGSGVAGWNITSDGEEELEFLDVSNSIANPAFWYAGNSIDGGGNTNWRFGYRGMDENSAAYLIVNLSTLILVGMLIIVILKIFLATGVGIMAVVFAGISIYALFSLLPGIQDAIVGLLTR